MVYLFMMSWWLKRSERSLHSNKGITAEDSTGLSFGIISSKLQHATLPLCSTSLALDLKHFESSCEAFSAALLPLQLN